MLQAVKLDPITAGIPVVILSQLTRDNEAELKENGAVGYFERSRLAEGAAGQSELIELIAKTLHETVVHDRHNDAFRGREDYATPRKTW